MKYPSTCPLCGAPRVGETLYACVASASPCSPSEIEAAVLVANRTAEASTAFLGALPPLYRGYAKRELAPEVLEINPELVVKLGRMSDHGFLYLCGDADAAKTHIAIRHALQFAQRGLSVLFVEETSYFAALLGEFGGGRPAPDLLAPDVLIYDDLGKRKPSAFGLERLYDLLNTRLAQRKALIITSNFTPGDVVLRMTDDPIVADALLSRLTSGQLAGVRRGKGGRKGIAI